MYLFTKRLNYQKNVRLIDLETLKPGSLYEIISCFMFCMFAQCTVGNEKCFLSTVDPWHESCFLTCGGLLNDSSQNPFKICIFPFKPTWGWMEKGWGTIYFVWSQALIALKKNYFMVQPRLHKQIGYWCALYIHWMLVNFFSY